MTVVLEPSVRVGIDPGIVFGDIAGDIVALRLETDSYLHLNRTGTFIFNRLQAGPLSCEEICGQVLQAFAVDAENGRAETMAFILRCVELGLLAKE